MLTLERPVDLARVRTLAGEEILFAEGTRPVALYQVQAGWIKLVRSSSTGRDTITDLLFPGDIFDLPSLLDGQSYLMRASSLSGGLAQVRCYDRQRALADHDLLALAQSQCMERMRFQRRMMAAMATERVEHRALMALSMLAERGGRLKFNMPLTRQEFGEWIGTTTETAIRTLSELRRRGCLSEDHGTITLSPCPGSTRAA